MRYLLILLFLFPLIGQAQQYALINKYLKQPILYTDSVSVEQVSQGYFPVIKTSIDTFLANLNYISNLLSDRSRAKMQSFEMKSGRTVIKTNRVPYAYGDRYDVNSTTDAGIVSAGFHIVNSETSNKKNKEYIDKLINYITRDQSLYGEYREIHPKLYNIYVIKE